MVDKEQDHYYRDWEFAYRPLKHDEPGFVQNLERKPDQKTYDYQTKKAEEMYSRSDKKQDKEDYIHQKTNKLIKADKYQEMQGKPLREDGVMDIAIPGEDKPFPGGDSLLR